MAVSEHGVGQPDALETLVGAKSSVPSFPGLGIQSHRVVQCPLFGMILVLQQGQCVEFKVPGLLNKLIDIQRRDDSVSVQSLLVYGLIFTIVRGADRDVIFEGS